MTREGFVASAQKCNGVCLPMLFDTQFIHFYLTDLRVSMHNLLLQGSLKNAFLNKCAINL